MRKEHNSKLTVTYPSTVFHKAGEEGVVDEPVGKMFALCSDMFALTCLYLRWTNF